MSFLSRIKSWFGGPFNGAQEGSWRGPFSGTGEFGNAFWLNSLEDGWQRHLHIGRAAEHVPAVYAAVMAQARAVSLCYAEHHIIQPDGLHEKQYDTWAAELLRNPNSYETWQQFIMNIVAEMLFRGESLAVIVRDDRAQPVALHRIQNGSWNVNIEDDQRQIFYGVSESGNPLTQLSYAVPARDVIHFRQYTPRHPLIGETPITAAALAIGINVALSESQISFFHQMRRPSGILSTDNMLTRDQLNQLREAFDLQAKNLKQGGLPILAGGLKFQPMSITSQDAELIEAQRMSIEDIARVFGVPLPVIGDLSKSTLNNAETLINHWLSLGLGSLLENLEKSFDKAFRFGSREYIELNTTALLRSNLKQRIDALTRAIQGGLMSVNEARQSEGLPRVDHGDEPMVQQQMVTVSNAAERDMKPPEPAEPKEPKEPDGDELKQFNGEILQAGIINMLNYKSTKDAANG